MTLSSFSVVSLRVSSAPPRLLLVLGHIIPVVWSRSPKPPPYFPFPRRTPLLLEVPPPRWAVRGCPRWCLRSWPVRGSAAPLPPLPKPPPHLSFPPPARDGYARRDIALCAAPPEAPTHSPSQTPLSCPAAPPSQRELHKDGGGGGGGGVARRRRARAARAPKAKSCATSCGTSSETPPATPCAAFYKCPSVTCSSFTCHLRAGVGGGARVLGVGSKAAMAADRTSPGVGLASGSPRAAACLFCP